MQPNEEKIVLFKSEKELKHITSLAEKTYAASNTTDKKPTLPVYIDKATGNEVECSHIVKCMPEDIPDHFAKYKKEWPDAYIVSVDAKFVRHSRDAFLKHQNSETPSEGTLNMSVNQLIKVTFGTDRLVLCGVFSDAAAKDMRKRGKDLQLFYDTVTNEEYLVTNTFTSPVALNKYKELYPDSKLACENMTFSKKVGEIPNNDQAIKFYKQDMELSPL